MRYGAMNSPLNSVLSEIELFSEMGFDYLELTMDAPRAHYTVIREQKNEILQSLDRHGMGLICHLPTFVYTADLTESIRRVSLQEMLESVDTAAEMGIGKAVLHAGMISGLGVIAKDMAKAYALESLHQIVRSAEEKNIFLCIENMPPNAGAFEKPEELEEIMKLCPNHGMTFDAGHAHIKSKNRVSEFMQRLGNQFSHLHLSDNRGKKDDHLPIGKGTINFPEIIRELKRIGYDDTVTFEIFTEDRREIMRSRETFISMLTEI
ncbi:MAG: sugar phosphate isomerase/epimerase family protein [Desulfococcaceae bacterium]|jgi:sugar phosphate isomerase/epimerase|nr:sugar phosphate isomerase/epimerase family protein [Desulfococcaceae bacterium]